MSNHEIQLNPASPADITVMALVWDQATAAREGRPIPDELTRPDRLDRLAELFGKPGAWACTATVDGRLAGFTIGSALIDPGTNIASESSDLLAYVMTSPEYWGKQIATRLIEWAIWRARQSNKQTLELWTLVDNERARRLYERLGFAAGQQVLRHPKLGIESVRYTLDV
jgi:GNAT superfamily N-acetyltransferase